MTEPTQARTNVLIADDNRDAADTLGAFMKLLGYDVRVVYDGEAAVQEATRMLPQVVLLDIGMPKLDGRAAARQIRGLPGGRDIKMVAVTGWNAAEDQRRSLEAGFDAHLPKPLDPQELMTVLARE